ncbi:MAG: type II CRISPR-associated endonuclease Cas1 [Bacteroidales bacterium]|nr:type II CRISPR-associated endonuclease Cas1 [Bacteroidales bacterium]
MIKKTLCFSNPAYISLKNQQLVIQLDKTEEKRTIPIEDIAYVLLDHQQITITHGAIAALLDNNAAIITCDSRHLPIGLMLPLEGNTLQSERFQSQIEASLPLRKQLWQQTVECKIRNQAALLKILYNCETRNMLAWANDVRSGDSTNLEGRAAVYYWSKMFPEQDDFTRDRNGIHPNAMLNYGYAVLRAVVARGLVASGLLPTLGIHHHNRYNAYCLADDIMEPYRPFVDLLVSNLTHQYPDQDEITTYIKRQLLTIPTLEVTISGQRSPLMIAVSQTTASLAKCYNGEMRRITYPTFDGQI